MKSFPSRAFLASAAALGALAVAFVALTVAAHADLPAWMQSLVSGSVTEAALFRAMDIPSTRTLYPRPPAEARAQLDPLVAARPDDAELYALRAHVEEQALDFASAGRDWNAFVEHSPNGPAKTSARFALADFYQRRNEGPPEIAALEAAASAPTTTAESFLPADRQTAWRAFPRALAVAHRQGLGDDATLAIYRAWIARYAHEPAARAAYLAALLSMRRFDDAQRAIDDYRTVFPADSAFPIKAEALLALDNGSPQATGQALTLFDRAFQPIWEPALVQSYIELLSATHTGHAAIAQARARLAQNPDDLRSAAFLFDAFVQQGRLDVATNTLSQYAASKEQRRASWTPDELNTFATLLERANQPADAARFDYALAATPGHLAHSAQTPEEAGLCGLIHLLLADSDAPIALGAGNLSIFRGIATTDQGPGYLNGILSLWLNSTSPAGEFRGEEARATPYFHRAKAAELLAVLDRRFPASTERAALHAMLIRDLLSYGDDNATLQAGEQFLAGFPQSPERIEIALDLADIDARNNDTRSEFALYDGLLNDLSAKLDGLPLTAAGAAASQAEPAIASPIGSITSEDDTDTGNAGLTPQPSAAELLARSLQVDVAPPPTLAIAQQYRAILDRYLSRLVSTGHLPAALALLRHELDRNPNDPLFYERLAEFLQQNNFAAQEGAVYEQAIARFQTAGFYDKLARVYLRQRRQREFDALTHKVVDTFRGTALETYFANVHSSWPQEFLQLNLYAHQRFPHDLVFTRNLLAAYQTRATADAAARELLLRQHWQDAPDLQVEFFALLSRGGRIGSEIAALQSLLPSGAAAQQDPAAARELAELDLWQSHFEDAAPLLGRLADQYPADPTLGDQAASVFRSLAYFDPPQAERAAAIERHLAAAAPSDLDHLATIGDILADSTDPSFNLDAAQQLAHAAVFWRHMPAVHPGLSDGYLQAATVFWDYFQFDDALAEIDAARQRFHSPALFAYQAGAIHENQRDDVRAIAEYIAAVTAPPVETGADAADARQRLLTLANRPATTPLVDHATAQAADANPSLVTLALRADILSAQHQTAAIAPLVVKAIDRATTAGDLAALANFASEHNLSDARDVALARQISLITDPVERIELQYQLVRVYTGQHNTAAAQRIIDSVYSANPRLIGVVRSTVDFDWSNHQQARSIAVLLEAARAANAELAHDFTLEAIDKSNHSGDYAGARRLLEPLLAADPFNPLYLNLQAQSFSLAHDDAGVRDFYTHVLTALRTASLPPAEKRARVALVRQSLIPALTALQDYAGAMNQHIALLSAFPEDNPTLQNAIAYAHLYHREPQLVAFLQQAVAASPRDSRFFIDLAKVDTAFEDNAGALAAYGQAIAIRSDRPDLYIARAELEERAQNFDAACADYQRLFTITYQDPQWMQKAALARAREGKPELAVKALEAAYLDGHAPTPEAYFTVARQLAQWNLLAQADPFATKGVALAGEDLATKASLSPDARFYAGLLARERKPAEAISFFAHLRDMADAASSSSPGVIAQQVAARGLASVTDAEWRRHLIETRSAQAASTFAAAVQSAASLAAQLYTPEEQAAFATLLDTQRANRPAEEVVRVWIPAATAAGLKGREALWRRDVLLHGGPFAPSQLQPYNQIELARMDFTPLAETLDAYVAQAGSNAQSLVLSMAATAWRDAGDSTREIADLRALVIRHRDAAFRQRLFELYLHGDPAALIALAGSSDVPLSDAAANFVLDRNDEPLTVQTIAAIPHRPAVWHSATRALAGLYYNDDAADTATAFAATLGSLTIGDQLAHRPDPQQQLIGEPWFAYGTHFGLLLAIATQPGRNSEDLLPAVLEQAPTDPASYTTLAATYLDAHNLPAALIEFRHALELAPADPSPLASIAEAEIDAGHRDKALAAYRDAFTRLRAWVDVQAVPETFWTTFARIAADARSYHLGPELRPEMNVVLSAYIRKNATYRTDELLQSAWIALGDEDPQRATAGLLLLIDELPAEDRQMALRSLTFSIPIPPAERGPILRAQVELQRSALSATPSSRQDYARQQLDEAIRAYAAWLLDRRQTAEAAALLDTVPAADRQSDRFAALDLLLAVQQARLPALLEAFRATPNNTPPLETLATVANTLRLQNDTADSRALLEFVFARRLERQQLTDADFLALAQARLNNGDLPGALNLLHRFTQQGDYYANLDAAASLLERSHHPAATLEFLQPLARGNPWNAGTQLRLAAAQLAARQPQAAAVLVAIASSAQAPYATRAQAALALHTAGAPGHFDSAELTLLATATPAHQQAAPPNFVYAHLVAAQSLAPAQAAPLLHSALLIAPGALSSFIRLRLFDANVALNHTEAASVAIQPVLDAHPSLRFVPSAETDNSATVADLSNAAEANAIGNNNEPAVVSASTPDDPLDPFSLDAVLPDTAAHIDFLLSLTAVDHATGSDILSVQDLRTALALQPQASQIDARLHALQAAMDLAAANVQRRPIIQPSVVQPVIVRPRLTVLPEVHP